jgi:hypothetical protein
VRRVFIFLGLIQLVAALWTWASAAPNLGGVYQSPAPATAAPTPVPVLLALGMYYNCLPATAPPAGPTPSPSLNCLSGYPTSVSAASTYFGLPIQWYMYFGESVTTTGYTDNGPTGNGVGAAGPGSFKWDNGGSIEYQAFNQVDVNNSPAPAMPLVTMGAGGQANGTGATCTSGSGGGPTNDSGIYAGTYDATIDQTALQRVNAYTHWHADAVSKSYLTKYPNAGRTIVRLLWEQNNGTQGNLLACDYISAVAHIINRARYTDGDTHTIFGYSPSGAGTCATNIAVGAGFTGGTPACFYTPWYEWPGMDSSGTRPLEDWFGWDNYDRAAQVGNSGCPSGTTYLSGVCDLYNLQISNYNTYVSLQPGGNCGATYLGICIPSEPVAWFETGADCMNAGPVQDNYMDDHTQGTVFRNAFPLLVGIDYFASNKPAGDWAPGGSGQSADVCTGKMMPNFVRYLAASPVATPAIP